MFGKKGLSIDLNSAEFWGIGGSWTERGYYPKCYAGIGQRVKDWAQPKSRLLVGVEGHRGALIPRCGS